MRGMPSMKSSASFDAVGRKSRGRGVAFDVGALHWRAAVERCGEDLRGRNVAGQIGEEGDLLGIARPGDVAQFQLAFDRDRASAEFATRRDRELCPSMM